MRPGQSVIRAKEHDPAALRRQAIERAIPRIIHATVRLPDNLQPLIRIHGKDIRRGIFRQSVLNQAFPIAMRLGEQGIQGALQRGCSIAHSHDYGKTAFGFHAMPPEGFTFFPTLDFPIFRAEFGVAANEGAGTAFPVVSCTSSPPR